MSTPDSNRGCGCVCVFDKQYLFGLHGLLDLGKVVCAVISVISLWIPDYSNKSLDFLLGTCIASLVITVMWLLLLGLCYGCLETCWASKWINWVKTVMVTNILMTIIYIPAFILGALGASSLKGSTAHTGVSVAVGFSVGSLLLHLFDSYAYYRLASSHTARPQDVKF